MLDAVNVAVVNFHAIWGDVQANVKRIGEYIEALAQRGANIVVFPETALSGYDYEKDQDLEMHRRLSVTLPGSITDEIAAITRKYQVYAAVGAPENDNGTIYNSAFVCGPEGYVGKYRKIHLPFDEGKWAKNGEEPFFFETPWGRVGVSICYDTYFFPEIIRYYKAKGVRLVLNCTATGHKEIAWNKLLTNALTCYSATNNVYIASANLTGQDKRTHFIGRSSIIGPVTESQESRVIAGYGFDSAEGEAPEAYLATLDLSDLPFHTYSHLFDRNVKVGTPDWRPELYSKICTEIMAQAAWQKKGV